MLKIKKKCCFKDAKINIFIQSSHLSAMLSDFVKPFKYYNYKINFCIIIVNKRYMYHRSTGKKH